MTLELVKLLTEKYPPINDFDRVSVYENSERIYLNICDIIFCSRKRTIEFNSIVDVAKQHFSVPFNYGNQGTIINGIFFEPETEKNKNYFGHIIEFGTLMPFPSMSIWTGNRGNGTLEKNQREQYLNFVDDVCKLYKK